MESKRIAIGKLTPNKGQIEGLPANPRQWTQTDIDRIARSLRETPELFEMRPCIVYPHGDKFVILGGNLRYTGAKANKDKDVPCIVMPEDTPVDKLKEVVLKDNGSFGAWDYDALANEWDDLPLQDWGVPSWNGETDEGEKEEYIGEDDGFSEETETIQTRCKSGDVWKLGNHRLVCGDATKAEDVARLMGGKVADLLLTDPPYNVDYSSKNEALNAIDKGERVQEDIANDKMTDEEFAVFLRKSFGNASEHLKDGGSFYVWTAQGHNQIDVALALDKSGLYFRQQIIWAKNMFVIGRMDYHCKHEPCYYGWKGGAGHYFFDSRKETTLIEDTKPDFKKMKKDELLKYLEGIFAERNATSVLHYDKPFVSADHPTMKPVPLFGYLIRNSSKPDEIVLDLFGGSGTTLIAAEQLGRRCYMMELDPHYCDVIISRWETFTGKTAQLITPGDKVS